LQLTTVGKNLFVLLLSCRILDNIAHSSTPASLPSASVVPAADDFAHHISDIVSQARQAMAAAQQRQKAVADKRRRHVFEALGDMLMLRADTLSFKAPGSRKLLPKLVGPFPIFPKIQTSLALVLGAERFPTIKKS
jgi:hypothetical protein